MNKLKSIWQIEDLRKKILFTLLLILVFRLGCSIPVPFVSNTALDSMFSNDSIFGYMNMLSGGALSRCAFFALGVSPYINSSIITQLLCVALPSWEALQKETTGKDKLDEYTKRIALAMAAIMSIGYYFVLRNYGALEYTAGKSGFFAAVVIMATFLAGSQLSVWIGGRIDEFGIGNGVSILIFAGIVSRWTDINTIAHNIAVQVESGNWLYSLVGIGMVVAMLFAVWFVSYSDGAERRIPVQYAARKYNARGQASYIPVKLLMSGVMPIIFAGVIMSIPATVDMFVDATKHVRLHSVLSVFSSGSWIYYAVYVILIALFNFFYKDSLAIDYPTDFSQLRKEGSCERLYIFSSQEDYDQAIKNREDGQAILKGEKTAPTKCVILNGSLMPGMHFSINSDGRLCVSVRALAEAYDSNTQYAEDAGLLYVPITYGHWEYVPSARALTKASEYFEIHGDRKTFKYTSRNTSYAWTDTMTLAQDNTFTMPIEDVSRIFGWEFWYNDNILKVVTDSLDDTNPDNFILQEVDTTVTEGEVENLDTSDSEEETENTDSEVDNQ